MTGKKKKNVFYFQTCRTHLPTLPLTVFRFISLPVFGF